MIVGEKFHSLNRNGKKQGCLTCPFPYTLLCAFGLFFIADVGQTAFQLCSKVRGLHGGMNWLARFFSEPCVQFLGRSSDESALPMNCRDLLPALECISRCRFVTFLGMLFHWTMRRASHKLWRKSIGKLFTLCWNKLAAFRMART
jgi:hypothetical protein